MERSSHWSFTNSPKLVGIAPVIWFLEISSLSSSMRFEIELGTWPAILLLPIFSTFKLNPSVNSGIVPEMRLFDTSRTSKKLLVLLFKMLDRDPNTRFEWRSIKEIPSGIISWERSNFSWLFESFSFCRLVIFVK